MNWLSAEHLQVTLDDAPLELAAPCVASLECLGELSIGTGQGETLICESLLASEPITYTAGLTAAQAAVLAQLRTSLSRTKV